jgi:hypothetical protein
MAGKTETDKPRNANQRYSAALARLRDNHTDEFQKLLTEEWNADGVQRPLSKEERAEKIAQEKREKAAEKLRSILTEYPDLLEVAGTEPAV